MADTLDPPYSGRLDRISQRCRTPHKAAEDRDVSAASGPWNGLIPPITQFPAPLRRSFRRVSGNDKRLRYKGLRGSTEDVKQNFESIANFFRDDAVPAGEWPGSDLDGIVHDELAGRTAIQVDQQMAVADKSTKPPDVILS